MATEAKGQRVNINGKATDVLFKDAAARNTLNQLTYPGHDQAIMGTDSYVCDVGQKFAPTLVSNTSLKLADGEGVLQGVRFRIPYGSTVTLTIASGTSGYKRIDLVVARYTKSTGAISFVVIKGTNATSSPATPAYNTGSVIAGTETVDFPLYKITIDGTAVSSVDKLFTQLQTMKEMQDAISKLNTDFNQNFESCAESYTCVRYKHFAHNVYARSRRGAKFHIAAINSTLYLVWLHDTNDISVTKLGSGTTQKGNGDVRVDNVRFHRADNLYLEIATDNDNVKVDITIYS